MTIKHVLAAASVLVASASVASAATETYSFLGNEPGTYYSSKDFTSNEGNTVTVTAGTFTDEISDGAESGAWVGQWTGYGLGVCSTAGQGYCAESHIVDGKGKNEFLKFSFDYDITIESIEFRDYGNNYFDLMLGDESDLLDKIYDSNGLFSSSIAALGNMFAIGAYYAGSGFKVQSITVSYDPPSEVPLPAAGWLLIAGLGGLVAMKRRADT